MEAGNEIGIEVENEIETVAGVVAEDVEVKDHRMPLSEPPAILPAHAAETEVGRTLAGNNGDMVVDDHYHVAVRRYQGEGEGYCKSVVDVDTVSVPSLANQK